MINGAPLFPGVSEQDQLKRIFKLLGSPRVDEWPQVLELPAYNPDYGAYERQPWNTVVCCTFISYRGYRFLNLATLVLICLTRCSNLTQVGVSQQRRPYAMSTSTTFWKAVVYLSEEMERNGPMAAALYHIINFF